MGFKQFPLGPDASMVLLSTTTLSGTSTTVTGISQAYNQLLIIVENTTAGSNGGRSWNFRDTNGNSLQMHVGETYGTTQYESSVGTGPFDISFGQDNLMSTGGEVVAFVVSNYASTTERKPFFFYGRLLMAGSVSKTIHGRGAITVTTAMAQFQWSSNVSLTGGTIKIWGIK